MSSASLWLRRFEDVKDSYGAGMATEKLKLMGQLVTSSLPGPAQVLRLHEALCFLRAYPDDPEVLRCVERLLGGFETRRDLRRHSKSLADTGIAGTAINYRFFWNMAQWLRNCWPDSISIDWAEFENAVEIEKLIHLLLPYAESPMWDMLDFTPQQWLTECKNSSETDAAFLIARFASLKASPFIRETMFEKLDPPLRIEPGPGTPSRTRARYEKSRVSFQNRPLDRSRPDLLREIKRPPLSVSDVSPREARRLISLAREAMVTRSRDLDGFANADPHDVRIVECEEGLQLVCYGLVPLRRLVLETSYALLTLKNGVPVGYVLLSSVFGCTEIAYNVFETFRGGDGARIFGRVLGTARHLFGSQGFSIDPYQLGYGNREGLESGAWWFYYKLGFRPYNEEINKVLLGELALMRKDRSHRSSIPTLEILSSDFLYLALSRSQEKVLGTYSIGHLGLRVTRYLAERFGGDRESGIATCSKEIATLLGVGSMKGLTAGERLAWARWSPLLSIIPGLANWSRADKLLATQVLLAKGAGRESDFVRLFESHKKLRNALLRLATEE